MRHYFTAGLPAFLIFLTWQSCTEPAPEKDHSKDRDKFAEHIRSTDFQTPEQERMGFKLPPGFEVTLFASEPDISKPINMQFDDKGRLWVTQSSEYPLPADPGKGKDRITILEDSNGDGKADKFTYFEDSLNIPIGIMPVADGAIAYSIPNIYYYTDTNNDGKADKQKLLFGKFGYRDTHGMVSNLIRGYDGWIHACHGFSNTSTIAGTDGDSITMRSGNTFRFRMDGSRVEQTSDGRVNPFGYTFDEMGYLYSVDCHSKPIYQIIRGGVYPGFGKKSPGIGYAPEMMSYELGSTALSGLEYYTAEQFPEEYRKSFYTGDVVTCQINRNSVTYAGSTPVSKREDDFLVSDDPWFRPVAIATGPDGSMYVADFYNRIIGHYEVSLTNPKRDRVSGRIWKISYKGDKPHKDGKPKDWWAASLQELIEGLQLPQLSLRMKIADRIVDTWKEKSIEPLKRIMPAAKRETYIQGLWILYRLNALPETLLDTALDNKEAMIRVHALRILAEMHHLNAAQKAAAVNALNDRDPDVRRAATAVLATYPDAQNIKLLVELYQKTDTTDTHLRYTTLMAIRNDLQNNKVINQVLAGKWSDAELSVLTKAMLDAPSPEAAKFLLSYITEHPVSKEALVSNFEYLGRYLSTAQLDPAIKLIRQKFPEDPQTQFELYQTMRQGIAQRGARPSAQMQQWAVGLSTRFLNNITESTDVFKSRPVNRMIDYEEAWAINDNFFTNFVPPFRIIYSERFGLTPTSLLYTLPFKLPAKLTMNIFDWEIYSSDAKIGISKNSVRIRLAGNNQLLKEYRREYKEPAPLRDVIQQDVAFDLSEWQGQEGYIEVIDSSSTSAIGIGNFKPAILQITEGTWTPADRRLKAVEIAAEYKATALEPELVNIVSAKWMNHKVRVAAAGALMNIAPAKHAALIRKIFSDKEEYVFLRKGFATALALSPSILSYELLEKALAGSERSLQSTIAGVLANSPEGINYLIKALKEGSVDASIVADVQVQEAVTSNIKPNQQKEFDALTAGAVNDRAGRDKIIQARLKIFETTDATADQGKSIFMQNCSVCHQIKGTGGMVGPQLDGIGNWGAIALAQKILDPNRNISEAFRTYNIKLKNGKVMIGLFRRNEGEVIVYADPSGKEFSVAKADIKENTASKYTLMPDQFRNTIPEKDFSALLKFLTSTK